MSENKNVTRRTLLRSIGRGGALAGIGALAAALIGRNRSAGNDVPAETGCSFAGRCGQCPEKPRCGQVRK